ncbi:MAG: hypothetical protein Hyperionvirus7_84 [Hyperionvirus sp.]|uniref:RING-type domain-containing protein n=1 Tax=Hyperionvirus sp. TaxID=2487770 RepID=A0A3G5ACB3_9VIRU|nr:MAG: hypothetical protein Hyperionvirus7_84 [Hyperionvirus sp.]
MAQNHLIAIATLTIYALVEIILLTLYSSKQWVADEIYNQAMTSGQIFTVAFNECMLALGLIQIIYYFNMHTNRFRVEQERCDDRRCMCSILIVAGVLLAIIFLFISFGLHCYQTTCFTVETPLYIMVLITVVLIGGPIACFWVFLVVMFIWDLFCGNICCVKKVLDHNKNPKITATYDIIQKFQEGVTACNDCKKPFEPDSAVRVFACSHYVHIACLEGKTNKCVTCEESAAIQIPMELAVKV